MKLVDMWQVKHTNGNGSVQANNSVSSRFDSWRNKWFKNKNNSKSFASPANGANMKCNNASSAANGSMCSDGSASSSPGLMAAHIREEMELNIW